MTTQIKLSEILTVENIPPVETVTTLNVEHVGITSVSVANGQTEYEVDVTFTAASLQAVYLYSDKAITVTPYNGGSAGTPIVLAAGVPVSWLTGKGTAPFVADVTKLLIANASGFAAAFKLIIGRDLTPA